MPDTALATPTPSDESVGGLAMAFRDGRSTCNQLPRYPQGASKYPDCLKVPGSSLQRFMTKSLNTCVSAAVDTNERRFGEGAEHRRGTAASGLAAYFFVLRAPRGSVTF